MLKKINNIITNTANTLRTVLEQTTLETTSQTNNVLTRSGGVRKSTTTSTTKIVLPARKPAPTKKWETVHKPEGWKVEFHLRTRKGEDKVKWTDMRWDDMSLVPVTLDKWGNEHVGVREYYADVWRNNLHKSFNAWELDLMCQVSVWHVTKTEPILYLTRWDGHLYGWLLENIRTDRGQEIVHEINTFIDKMNVLVDLFVAQAKIILEYEDKEKERVLKLQEEVCDLKHKILERDWALGDIKRAMGLDQETAISDIAGTLESMFERGIRPGDITEKTDDIVEEDTPHGRYLMEKHNNDADENLEW